MDAARACDVGWRRAKVRFEQSAHLSRAQAKPIRESVDAFFVERAIANQPQAARHGGRRTLPRRCAGRGVGAAAAARPEALGLSRGRTGVEPDVAAGRRSCRADRAAVNAGRGDAGEEPSVETGIAARERAVAGRGIKRHASVIRWMAPGDWQYSDIAAGRSSKVLPRFL